MTQERTPVWKYESLEDVPDDQVAAVFEPVPRPENAAE